MQQNRGIEYLLRSDNRTAVLLALNQEQPLDRYDLERRLSASRRTVTRILTTFDEQGYITESSDGYRLTTFGAVVADAYRQCKEQTDLATQYRPFLTNVDSSAVDLDPTLLRGADLTVASNVSPYAPLDRMLELRRSASRVRTVTPLVERKSVEQLASRLRRGDDVTFEVVFSAELYETVESQPEYGEPIRSAAGAASVEKFVYPGPVSTLYAVTDDVAALGATLDGDPHALVESTDPELRAWVTDRIDEFRADAVPLEEYSREDGRV